MILDVFPNDSISHRRAASIISLLLAAAISPMTAHGQDAIPRCDRATNPRAIRRAHRRGIEHYNRAMRDPPTPGAMAEALRDFEAECAAGNVLALEYRAYALFGLGRDVEAVRTLDALLALQSLDSLPPSVQTRIAEQRPHLLARVATLNLRSNVPGAQAVINEQTPVALPLREHRVAPGRVRVEVRAPGYAPWSRELQLDAGSTRDELAELTRAAEENELPPRFIGPDEPPPPDSTAHVRTPHARMPAESSSPHPFRPWAIATLTGGLVLGVAGAVASIWRLDRASAYEQNCPTDDAPGCPSIYDQFVLARGLQIGTFVGAGALLTTSVVLWILDARHGTPAQQAERAGLTCAPGAWPTAIECALRF